MSKKKRLHKLPLKTKLVVAFATALILTFGLWLNNAEIRAYRNELTWNSRLHEFQAAGESFPRFRLRGTISTCRRRRYRMETSGLSAYIAGTH